MADKCMLGSGQKIVFLGDSITQAGDGYVYVVQSVIGALAPDLDLAYVNSGIGGHKVTDMLDRVERDVIEHKPDWVTVSVGINDVWHGENGVPIEVFKVKYDELIDRLCSETNVSLVLFTTTVIGEDLGNDANAKLIAYNDHIRQVAGDRDLLLVDMNKVFHSAITRWHELGTELRFTTDGVHTNAIGAYLMAHALAKVWEIL